MEEVLSLCQETLKKFLLPLSVGNQHLVSLEAKVIFLKNPNTWQAGYCVPQDEEEEDVNTAINSGTEEKTPQVDDVT